MGMLMLPESWGLVPFGICRRIRSGLRGGGGMGMEVIVRGFGFCGFWSRTIVWAFPFSFFIQILYCINPAGM